MRRVLAALAALLLALCALPARAEGLRPDAETHAAREEKLFALLEKYSAMGAVVCLLENGQVTDTFVYGMRDPKNKLPMTADTLFKVGSISKLVTGVGLMQLVERGLIGLDDDLSGVMGYAIRNPSYPELPVTLRQVMTHTASLRDNGLYELATDGAPRSLRQIFQDKTEFLFYPKIAPGTAREYSNFGGGLGGAVLEQLTGQTLDEYMQANVFAPLGITAAYQAALLPDDAKLANIYHMPGKQLGKNVIAERDVPAVTEADPDRQYAYSAGRLLISADGLARVLIALCDDGVYGDARILRTETARLMRTPQNWVGSVDCQSNCGLFMNILTDDQVEGRTLYGHGGKTYGMLCAAYFDPTDRTGVVMLTNGCSLRSVHNGVGMLGRLVCTLCYREFISPTHITADPYLVED